MGMQIPSSVTAELPSISKRSLVNPFAEVAPKEWWYAGCHDPESGTYFSFFFYRMPLLDAARVSVFDPASGGVREFGWKVAFQAGEENGRLRIEIAEKGLGMVYRRVDDKNWHFTMKGRGWEVDLEIKQTLPAFERREDRRGVPSGIVHWLGNAVSGQVLTHGASYRYRAARGYCDHSWGPVPRRVGWHWIAVQSQTMCLVSLVNTGTGAQLYTQVLVRPVPGSVDEPRWTRLDPQAVFGEVPVGSPETTWTAVSTDLELEVRIRQWSGFRERIPPLIPFLVNIDHQESFVSAKGRVRLDGIWHDTGEMFGVMEVHRGTW